MMATVTDEIPAVVTRIRSKATRQDISLGPPALYSPKPVISETV